MSLPPARLLVARRSPGRHHADAAAPPTPPVTHPWCRRARHCPVRKRGITSMAITVYSKPMCEQCDANKRDVDKAAHPYDTVYIAEDPDDLAALVSLASTQAHIIGAVVI